MDGNILIVGGYGNVGRRISSTLGERFPGRVLAAGRNYAKARELAISTGMKVRPLQMDVLTFQEGTRLPEDVRLVVMCLDLPDATFVGKCLQQGVHYVDISANYSLLSQIELLDPVAKQHNATAVLSVGLAPGLTNLLASHCKLKLDELKRADIFILLGLGEAHGEAALRWTIENFNSAFTVFENGVVKQVASFHEAKRTVFPEGVGERTAYRFNFSEQHVLPGTLRIPSASTWFCFDSSLTTHLFAFFEKTGLLNLLRFGPVRESLVKVFRTLQFGSDMFVMKVDAQGTANGREAFYECSASGYGEGSGTALIASEVARSLFSRSFTPGVFHIEQLFDPAEIFSKLKGSLVFSL
jgi:saccharopine dehydrogenase-like NADP-dependent oxidoreductase